MGSIRPPAATGGASSAGKAKEGAGNVPQELASSSLGDMPPLSAAKAVPGKLLQPTNNGPSDDLGAYGRRDYGEGSVGLPGVLSGSTSSARSGNGGLRNLAGILPNCAAQVLDPLTVRAQSPFPGLDAHVEVGEAWEKGPRLIVRDGSSIRSIYSSSLPGSSIDAAGAGRPDQIAPAIPNVANTQRSGLMGGPRDDLSADVGGAGRAGRAPGRAGRAAGTNSSVAHTVRSADWASFQRATISPSGGLEGSKGALWQDGGSVYTPARDGSEGGTGRIGFGGANSAKCLTDCALPGSTSQVFARVSDATDFGSSEVLQRGQGGMEGGRLDSISSGAPGAVAHWTDNAGPSIRPASQRQPAAAQAELLEGEAEGINKRICDGGLPLWEDF